MIRKLGASALAFAAVVFCSSAAAQVQRSFVASNGSDANTILNCTFSSPCRGFAAAQTVTADGGEIVALDAAGFGAISITKSLTLTSNPGFYAGIAASTGNAITIATTGVKATIRGLNINGVGGVTGIAMTGGTSLTVENCVISGFSDDGIHVNVPNAKVHISNTTVRGNGGDGFELGAGTADISNSKFLDNGQGGVIAWSTTGNTARVIASDTVSSGNGWGFVSLLDTGTAANILLTRVTASGNNFSAVQTESNGNLTVGSSNLSGNGYGMANLAGVLETMNNNLLRANGTQTSGVVTGITGSGIGPVTNAVPQ